MGKPVDRTNELDGFFAQVSAPHSAPSSALGTVQTPTSGGEEAVEDLRRQANDLLVQARGLEKANAAAEKAACLARIKELIDKLSPFFHAEKWVPLTTLKAAEGRLPEGFDAHLFIKQTEIRGELRDLKKREFEGEECVVLENSWPNPMGDYTTKESVAVTALSKPNADFLQALMAAWNEYVLKHKGSSNDLPDRVSNDFLRHLLGSRADENFGAPFSRASFKLEEGEKIPAYDRGSGAMSHRASKVSIPPVRKVVDLMVFTGKDLRKYW